MNATNDIELTLEPLAITVEKSVDDEPNIIRTAFGKKNRVIIGAPVLRSFEPKSFGLTAKEADHYRRNGLALATVATTVSFVPDFGCKFVAADISLSFSTDPRSDTATAAPTVVNIHPRESVRQDTYKSQRKVSAKLKGSASAGFAKLLGELNESRSFQVNGKTMIKNVYAFGLNGGEAGWRFQASLGHELAGIYEDLALAVRRPVDTRLFGEVKLAAEIAVEGMLDRWVTVAFGLSQKRARVDKLFELMPA
jgi:hypothetical protein